MTAIPVERIVAALKHAGLFVDLSGTLRDHVADITDDSRQIVPNGLFVAVRGSERDGHDFLPQAGAAGAVAAIVEDPERTSLPAIVVREGRRAAAVAAAAAFDDPAKQLRLAAVTGTNGKTTTVGILRHLLDKPDARSASIGTLGVLLGSDGVPVAAAPRSPRPDQSSCSAHCAPWWTAACEPWRWSSPRTASTSAAPRRSPSRRECSRISPAIISTITKRWRRISPRSRA